MAREDETGMMEKPMAVKHLRLGEVRNGVLGKDSYTLLQMAEAMLGVNLSKLRTPSVA